MVAGAGLIVVLIGNAFLPGATTFTWSNNIQDGKPVYACAGGSVQLPWSISKQSEYDGITDIKWFFQRQNSQEMIAILDKDKFLPMPSYQQRVKNVKTGGLFLREVTLHDIGNYTIEIRGHDASGTFFIDRHVVPIQVADGRIQVFQEPQAKWDNSDHNFHVVLSCGTFPYLTYPPFEAEWTHPDGKIENSTGFSDGKFQLLLANPIKGGDYTCRIPEHSAAKTCQPKQTTKSFTASVNINSLEGRLTVLEAQQTSLQTKAEKMETENSRLKGENTDLKHEVVSLTNRLSEMENDVLEDRHIISFSAKLSSQINMGIIERATLIPTDVLSNEGEGYNTTTGIFTVPKNGTYVFMATTSSYLAAFYSSAQIVSDDFLLCTIDSGAPGETASCQATVSLYTGQRVWLESSYLWGTNYFNARTSFSGFMLRAR